MVDAEVPFFCGNRRLEKRKSKLDTKNKIFETCNDGTRINFNKLGANDLPSNNYLITPGPIDIKEEIEIQNSKTAHNETVKEYVSKFCTKDGTITNGENLTAMELAGRAEIEYGIKTKGWMVYKTDKSGRMCRTQ